MFEVIQREQATQVAWLVVGGVMAGVSFGFCCWGWFIPIYWRILLIGPTLIGLAMIWHAVIELFPLRREARHLRRLMRANERGPKASPLHTPDGRHADDLGDVDVFGTRH